MLGLLMMSLLGHADGVRELASANGFNPTNETVEAIEQAAKKYKLNPKDLAAIAIIESGIGVNIKPNKNKNKSVDVGLFQVNTINHKRCLAYKLHTNKGNALCAAKLLSELKKTRKDFIGAYHSKTPSVKLVYIKKYDRIMGIYKKSFIVNN